MGVSAPLVQSVNYAQEPGTSELLYTLRCGKPFWIEPEVQGELRIQPDQTRRRDRSRLEPGEKTIRQPRVAVVKFTEFYCLGLYVHCVSSMRH